MMAAATHAPPTLASSSPFLFSSPLPSPLRLSSLRLAPLRSDFLGYGRTRLQSPRGHQRRALCPSGSGFSGFDGRSVVLVLAAAATNSAVLQLVLLNYAQLRKKSNEIFHEMVNAGGVPNVHTYGALIDGCSRAGQVAKAFGGHGIMRSK